MTTPAESAAPGAQVAEYDATVELNDAVRDLIAALRLADAPADALAKARDLVAEATSLLDPHVVGGELIMQGALRPSLMATHQPDVERLPEEFFPYSPAIGPLNPISPKLTFRFDGERMHGHGTVRAPHVGPPGMVHGGIIALIFDELLGATNVSHGKGAFTGTLSVRYERPTPLGQELDMEAWVDRVEGRKIFTAGTISHDGQVTARAEGIFIQADVDMSRPGT